MILIGLAGNVCATACVTSRETSNESQRDIGAPLQKARVVVT
jgi:hypothetical protein